MSGHESKLLQPMLHRFVYGLFYPGILGANLILLFGSTGDSNSHYIELYSSQFPLLLAWIMTLLLFTLDFVGTATTKEIPNAPPETSFLAVIDFFAAAAFFIAQSNIAAAGTSQDINWAYLWWCLMSLHILYFLWYYIRRKQAKGDNQRVYKEYITKLYSIVATQLVLFLLASLIFKPVGAIEYCALVGIALISWSARMRVEYLFVAKGEK